MLSFDLGAIESQPVQVAGTLGADDEVWEDDDVRPGAPIEVAGRLSRAGPGKFYFHGTMRGVLRAECRRCLTDVSEDVDEELYLIFAESDDEDTAGDPDVYQLDERAVELDLRPALREQWLLLAPPYSLCKEDCKGLCPSCGADRNVTSCACAPATDGRWDALRGARSGQSK